MAAPPGASIAVYAPSSSVPLEVFGADGVTARAGNRRFRLLSALRAYTKPPIQNRFTVGNAKGA